MACKDTQKDPDFQVVARLEAFITGYGLDEAYKRADAYHAAGADAILCHSKKSDDTDIKAFMEAWGDRCPVIIVPTKYPNVPVSTFEGYGVSTIIWANHNMRGAIVAMREITEEIYNTTSLAGVEGSGKVCPVAEVFRYHPLHNIRSRCFISGSFLPCFWSWRRDCDFDHTSRYGGCARHRSER